MSVCIYCLVALIVWHFGRFVRIGFWMMSAPNELAVCVCGTRAVCMCVCGIVAANHFIIIPNGAGTVDIMLN